MNEALDVQCLPYMPLQIERLRKSKAWLRCKRNPEIAFYMVNLWMRAWHEIPAGSIEDDDDVLADAAMCSPEKWELLKDDILHGWERRDGRVWHSTVTEIATESAGKLRRNKTRTAAAREAREQQRQSSVTELVTAHVTDDVTVSVTEPEGKGREEKRIKETPDGVSKKHAVRLSADWQCPSEWIDEAVEAGLSRPKALAEAERMKNWSLSNPKGAKLNWHAAWKNWYTDKLDQPKKTGTTKAALFARM